MPNWESARTLPTYKIRQQLIRWARVTLRTVLRGGHRTLNGYVTRIRATGKRAADGDEDGAVPTGNKHQRASQPDERPQRQLALPGVPRRTATAASSSAVTAADRPTATAAAAQQAASGKRRLGPHATASARSIARTRTTGSEPDLALANPPATSQKQQRSNDPPHSRQQDGPNTKRRRTPVAPGQGTERFLSPLPASTGQPCPPQEHPAPLPPPEPPPKSPQHPQQP